MTEDIKTISMSTRKKFNIDGDYNRVLELDTSDMNVVVRLNDAYPKMEAKAREAATRLGEQATSDDDESDALGSLSATLKDIDKQMREELDYIFDSNVSEMCAPKGNMYDPVNGEFRFEHIIDVLTRLYANDFTIEFKKMQDRVKKHTAKYTNRRKK